MVNATVLSINKCPTLISCSLNNSSSVSFQLDNGSAISTITKDYCLEVGGVINPTRRTLVGYSGNKVELLGQASLVITYNISLTNTFLVAPSGTVNLSLYEI